MTGRRILRASTFVLLALCLWTVYANVLSDDTAVRAKARELADTTAGCGDKCKVVGMNGERGMFSEEIVFDISPQGSFTVTCRRSGVIFGEYACVAAKR